MWLRNGLNPHCPSRPCPQPHLAGCHRWALSGRMMLALTLLGWRLFTTQGWFVFVIQRVREHARSAYASVRHCTLIVCRYVYRKIVRDTVGEKKPRKTLASAPRPRIHVILPAQGWRRRAPRSSSPQGPSFAARSGHHCRQSSQHLPDSRPIASSAF